MLRCFVVLPLALFLSACELAATPPQPGGVNTPSSDATPAPLASTVPTVVATPTPEVSATPTPKPTPTPLKVPAPSVEGYVYFDRTADDVLPSNMPKLVDVDVVALSKTPDKPYFRQVKASPRFEFTDLPYEAEIEISSALEGWTRGVRTITTGPQPIRMSVTIPMKTQIYANVPVQ